MKKDLAAENAEERGIENTKKHFRVFRILPRLSFFVF